MRWLNASRGIRSFGLHNLTARLSSTTASNSAVVLRPYQESALDACTTALEDGASRIGVSLPTGSGKTTVFLSLLSRIAPPKDKPQATQSLVIVNAIELARQAAVQAKRLFPDWTVEIEQGAKHKASGTADMYARMFNFDVLRNQCLYRAELWLRTRLCCNQTAWPSLTLSVLRLSWWTRHTMPQHLREHTENITIWQGLTEVLQIPANSCSISPWCAQSGQGPRRSFAFTHHSYCWIFSHF